MSKREIQTVNPETGNPLSTYALHSAAEITEILHRCRAAQQSWRERPVEQRASALTLVAEKLRAEKKSLAELIRAEMGKSTAEAESEVEKCATCADYYAEKAAEFLRPRDIPTEAAHSFVSFEPLGVVLAVMPWNFPLWQVFRCALPAVAAGNTVALKHASNVTGSALAIEKIWHEATGEAHLLRTLLLRGEDTLPLLARPEIAAVSFTGSTEVGRQIAAAAGKALKKCVLELGGSDAYVVLADADLPRAAKICAQSRLLNHGQSCIAAKRFVVEEKVLALFTELFLAELKKAPVAALAREDLRATLQKQVEASVAAGAQVRLGGEIPSGRGWHYPPTLLTGVRPGMPAFDEELFGPVAAVISAPDESAALALANQSRFGLGAAVFTRDSNRGERLAQRELQAGSCFVNDLVRSDPRLPFGGIKDSGFGRELSEFGLREFVNIKTIYVAR